MRFMLLVKANEDSEAGVMPSDEMLSAMTDFNEELVKKGMMLDGAGLHPSSKGFRVEYNKGSFSVIDGPFAETKELVAGYWLIQAGSLQEAIDWVKRVPTDPKNPGQTGQIEIRPLYETEDFPVKPDEQPDGWRVHEEEMRANPPAPERKPGTTRYLGMLKADAKTEAGVFPEDDKIFQEMGELMQELAEKGLLLGGEGLKPSRDGARVDFTGSKVTVTDGPFPETKELVAGYCLMQLAGKEEAIEWTKRFLRIHTEGSGVDHAVCELRPLFEMEDFAPSDAVDRAYSVLESASR